jgi:enoyl-CoA hydratase/carnithine racemase
LVVLTGAGRGFCAAGDVAALQGPEEMTVLQHVAELRANADALATVGRT